MSDGMTDGTHLPPPFHSWSMTYRLSNVGGYLIHAVNAEDEDDAFAALNSQILFVPHELKMS